MSLTTIYLEAMRELSEAVGATEAITMTVRKKAEMEAQVQSALRSGDKDAYIRKSEIVTAIDQALRAFTYQHRSAELRKRRAQRIASANGAERCPPDTRTLGHTTVG